MRSRDAGARDGWDANPRPRAVPAAQQALHWGLGAREVPRKDFIIMLPQSADYGRNKAHWPLQ